LTTPCVDDGLPLEAQSLTGWKLHVCRSLPMALARLRVTLPTRCQADARWSAAAFTYRVSRTKTVR